MSDDSKSRIDPGASSERHRTRTEMERLVGAKERRRLRARRRGDRSVWFGLGMFGVIGWSVAVPMVAGIAVGLWIDTRIESARSWTLMLMIAGLGVGCLNAWAWVARESAEQSEPAEPTVSSHDDEDESR